MEKICLVVQRYGLEVNGGAELQCRQFAEHLIAYYQVDVVTTKAIDYMTWKDEYKQDRVNINGVNVIRFSVENERNIDEFNEINKLIYEGGIPLNREKEWIEKQGPKVPELCAYLRKHKDEYRVFIFFTYLYYPTVIGISEVADKAILIPEAHDEPFLKMNIIRNVFSLPKAFLYNTEEERQLVNQKFHNQDIPSELGGVGVDLPEDINAERFKKKYGLDKFIVYVGRIDEGKNCNQMFTYFQEYKKRNSGDLKLVLMGKNVIDIPKDDNIGRVRITRAYVEHTGGPVIELRGQEPLILASEN